MLKLLKVALDIKSLFSSLQIFSDQDYIQFCNHCIYRNN